MAVPQSRMRVNLRSARARALVPTFDVGTHLFTKLHFVHIAVAAGWTTTRARGYPPASQTKCNFVDYCVPKLSLGPSARRP
jgi:hypothetical protein